MYFTILKWRGPLILLIKNFIKKLQDITGLKMLLVHMSRILIFFYSKKKKKTFRLLSRTPTEESETLFKTRTPDLLVSLSARMTRNLLEDVSVPFWTIPGLRSGPRVSVPLDPRRIPGGRPDLPVSEKEGRVVLTLLPHNPLILMSRP